MSLARYVTGRLAAMQLDCPVLPAPACAEPIGEEPAAGFRHGPAPVDEGDVADELAAVAVLGDN
jgi:hypothetical protein